MADFKPQKVESKSSQLSKRELYAQVAYYYHQYTLKEVAQLPYRDIVLLLRIAQREQASYMHNLTLIAQAPHSKKQSNVKKLVEHFKKLAGK